VNSGVFVPNPAGSSGSGVSWPARCGIVPPLTEGFIVRTESLPGALQPLAPGETLALIPGKVTASGSADWQGSGGKTQLAVFLAESLWKARELDLLVWITAASRACILSGYVAAAAAVTGIDPAGDADSAAARFLTWLAETSRAWLVVLDSLTAPSDLDGLWPGGPAGRTLISVADGSVSFDTSRVRTLPVGGFTRREALSYLMDRLSEDRGQRSGAIDLVDHLGGEPLALLQASAVIESSALSCRDYQELFVRRLGQLSGSGQPAAAAICWILSVEHADRLSADGPVQPTLILAALLDGRGIPGTVFTTLAARAYLNAGRRPEPASLDQAWQAVLCLQQAGLLTADSAQNPPVVRIASAIQRAVRSATPADTADHAASVAASALVEAWTDSEPHSWHAQALRSCAARVAELAGDQLWTADGYRLLFRLGQSLDTARLHGLAAVHWSQVATASDKFLGPAHPDSLAASDQLASAFIAAGRAAEALPWFQRVLTDRKNQLGQSHPATTRFEARLGGALLAAGRPKDAMVALEHAIRENELAGRTDHLDTLDAFDTLAQCYRVAGQFADAIRLYRRVLSDRERLQGETHPQAMASGLKLGDAQFAAGQFKDALARYKLVAQGLERTLGADHPQTMLARGRLADASRSAGKIAGALLRRRPSAR